jgi:hypothetical protein
MTWGAPSEESDDASEWAGECAREQGQWNRKKQRMQRMWW